MTFQASNRDRFTLIATLAVWVGIWGGWIAHTTAGLTQNAFYLAEWSTYLLDVRFGGMRLAPELIRLAVALGSVSACIALASIQNWPLRWAVRFLVIPVGFNLLPPYPDILNLWWSEGYGVRFLVSALFWIGIAGCLLIDRLNPRIRSVTLTALAASAVICTVSGFAQLQGPFSAHYASTVLPGWGLVVFGVGLTAAITLQVWGLVKSVHGNQKGSEVI